MAHLYIASYEAPDGGEMPAHFEDTVQLAMHLRMRLELRSNTTSLGKVILSPEVEADELCQKLQLVSGLRPWGGGATTVTVLAEPNFEGLPIDIRPDRTRGHIKNEIVEGYCDTLVESVQAEGISTLVIASRLATHGVADHIRTRDEHQFVGQSVDPTGVYGFHLSSPRTPISQDF